MTPFPIETFAASGNRDSGDASQRVRYVSPRMENTGGVGIGIKANAQSTVVMGEFSLELHSASG